MKVLFFDCFSGISGDMVLGAFIDLGIDLAYLQAELKKAESQRVSHRSRSHHEKGISGTRCHVILDADRHHHRHFNDIKEIIENRDPLGRG